MTANVTYRLSTQGVAPGTTTTKNAPLTNAEIDGNLKSILTDVDLKAPIASPTFTGVPLSTTPDVGDNSTKIATTAFVVANTVAKTAAATAGAFDTTATTPTGTTRLNYGGALYPTSINLVGTADTAVAASHYFIETASDGVVRPKTLANVKTEVVTTAAVNSAAATTVGTVTSGVWNGTLISVAAGGTGVNSWPTGSIPCGANQNAITNIGNVVPGSVLLSNSPSNPYFGKVGLTTHVADTLPIANGGTGQTTAQLAINALTGAVSNATYLRGNGTNVVMSAIQALDVPTLNQSTTGTATNAVNLDGTGTAKTSATEGSGYGLWNSPAVTYGTMMSAATNVSYGGRIAGETTSDYNMYFTMNGGTNRGFLFRSAYGTNLLSVNPDGIRTGLTITAPSFNGAASTANWLNVNAALNYGANGLNYFNMSGTAGNSAISNSVPTSDWHHILRMNHANATGYYVDIAAGLNSSSLHYRRITGGVANGWYSVLDELNYSSYTPTLAGVGAYGTWGINITGAAPANLLGGTTLATGVTASSLTSVGTLTSLAVSGSATIGTNLTVTGNLTVSGTTTSINSTTLDVADLNITMAKNAVSAAAANGAGLTIGNYASNPTLLYGSASDNFTFNKAVLATSFNAITGLSSTNPVMDGTLAVGTATTVARADHVHPVDTSRAASSHAHGNITSGGAIGATTNLPVITGASGVLTTSTFGTAVNTFCQGNDVRLSDARVASDVYTWAKAATKPTYTQTEVGLGNVNNTADINKSVNYAASAGTVTNGVYTTGDQTVGGVKTFSSKVILGAGTAASPAFTWSGEPGLDTGMYWVSDGVMGFANNAVHSGQIASGGNLTMVGNVTAYSDIRIKTNITRISGALDKVDQLNGYTFDRTDINTPRQTGVIAQEVLKVLPEAVLGTEETIYTVAYGNMVGLLIEAIKELRAEVAELRGMK